MKRLLIISLLVAFISSAQAAPKLKQETAPSSPKEAPLRTVPPLSTPPEKTKPASGIAPIVKDTDLEDKSLHEKVADFVVKHSPELQKIKEATKLLENIKFDVGGRFAQQTAGTTATFGSSENENRRWEIMFNLTLVDKKSIKEQELLYIQTERRLRQEITALVDQYLQIQKAIDSAKRSLELWNRYIAWTEKRVQAGVEYAKTYYDLLLRSALAERKTELPKSLDYTVQMICSYVDRDNCYEVKKLLGADKINPDDSDLLEKVKSIPHDTDISKD